MDLRLAGKRALITGASKGIGLAAAFSLGREGCEVVIAARDGDALDRAVQELRSASITANGIA